MKRLVGNIFILLSILTVQTVLCQKSTQADIGTEINSISSDNFSDLSFLDPLVQGKKIVFLGESQHGINDFNVIKFRLIRYLNQKHGFNVVAFESGVATCGLTNLVKDSLSGMRMLVHSLLGIWRVKGNCEMMDYFRENNVEIAGLDPNHGALFLNSHQINIVLQNQEISLKLAELDSLNLYTFQMPRSRSYFGHEIITEKHLDSVATSLTNEYRMLEAKINHLTNLNDTQKRIFKIAFEANLQCLSVSNDCENSQFFISFNERDKLMAKNLEYLHDTLYPDKKIIVWAHNAHISKIANNKKMNNGASIGYYLSEETSKQSCVIGLYATNGQYALGMNPCNTIEYRNNSLEKVYSRFHSKAIFLESKKIKNKKFLHGIPGGYLTNVSKMYDGIIIIKDVECSKLLKYNKNFECE